MAQAWETIIGQGLVNLAGNSANCNTGTLGTILYGVTGINCGLYVLGILCLLLFIIYGFATGVSSEVIIFITILLTLYLIKWGALPAVAGLILILISGLAVHKFLTRA